MKIHTADGCYTQVSERFQRGALKDLSRALKAETHDAAAIVSWGGHERHGKNNRGLQPEQSKMAQANECSFKSGWDMHGDKHRGGGNLEPKILTPKRTEYGKAVRHDYESGFIDESRHNMTALEPKPDGTANTLTSVQKDNLLLEPREALAVDEQNTAFRTDVFGTITTDGSSPKHNNRVIPDAKDFDPCMEYEVVEVELQGKKIGAILQDGRIYLVRKLTPRECLRLMGWKDVQIDKVVASGASNSAMYKQAGNGIVVDNLEAIFTELLLSETEEHEIDVGNFVEVNQVKLWQALCGA